MLFNWLTIPSDGQTIFTGTANKAGYKSCAPNWGSAYQVPHAQKRVVDVVTIMVLPTVTPEPLEQSWCVAFTPVAGRGEEPVQTGQLSSIMDTFPEEWARREQSYLWQEPG